MRVLVAILVLCSLAFAEVQMNVDQLRAFITSSRQLSHSDKQVAEYLRGVKVTQKLEPGVIEDMTGVAGPKTMEQLRRLAEGSKSLTAPPPPVVPIAPATIPPPSSEEQGRILDRVRDYALDYSKRLPNFICTQVTRRYIDPAGLEFWQQQDTITSKLSYFEQKEDYKVVLVNNRYVNTSMEKLGGATSTGEFGSMMQQIFEAASNTTFEWERWATLRGRRMYVFAYNVPQQYSKWSIVYDGRDMVRPQYGGLVYVDRDTNAVMRITLEARNLPAAFAVQQANTQLDYDYQTIGGTPYVLPLKATVRMRSGKMLTKNDAEFRMYNRFGAEATITFEPEPLSDDQLKEQGAQESAPRAPSAAKPASTKKKK
ncbi:MAG: hypothetical protein SGI92_11620 [Bryobacteraceae bacterium]|nr:hypothetical protein [Bryobacteraceae bacterium]